MSYIKRRTYPLESDSPEHYSRNVANMPIFEDSELYNINSRNFRSEQHALAEKFGPVSTPPSSSALKALQDYGSTFLTDTVNSVRQKHDQQDKDMNTFVNLDLNSVDEEDVFLYGNDSNSLPEEPRLVLGNSEAGVNRSNSGWSDEDDYYGESTMSQSNLKSNVNNPVIGQNEKSFPKASHKTLGDKSSSTAPNKVFSEKKKSKSPEIIHDTRSPVNTVKDHNVSPYIKSMNVVERNVSNNTYLPEVPTTATKSKYHAAAQILKKQPETQDLRNKLKSLSNNRELYNSNHPVMKKQEHPRIELSNKPTGKRTVVLPKTPHKSEERELSSNNRASSFCENQRYGPKYFPQKDIESIRNYIKDSSRNNDSSSREHLHEMRSSVKSPKERDISPGRHISPSFESARFHTRRISRSPSLEPPRMHSRHRSPYTSRHRSPDYKYKHRSPSRSVRLKSPLDDINKPSYEYRSKYAIVRDRPRHYSRSPIRRSRERSPGYHKRRNRSRSRDKSKSPMYHRSRDHSPRAKYLKITEDKREKSVHERSVNSKRQYSKDSQKSRESSSSSFCSLSFESHSLSSDNGHSEESAFEKKYSKKSEKSSFKKKLKLDSPKKKKLLGDLANKSVDIIPSKSEEKSEIVQCNTLNKNLEKKNDSDIVKNFSQADQEIYNMVSNAFDEAEVVTLLINAQETINKLEDSVPLPNSPMPFFNEDVSNTLAVPNQPMPDIPFSQLSFNPFNPAMHPMPAPYPTANNYPPLMPSQMLPPILPNSPYYNPYIIPEMNAEMDYPLPVEPKQVHKKRPPVTLRSIPVSDNLNITPAIINTQPSLGKSEPSKLSPGKIKIQPKEKILPKTQLIALKESKIQETQTQVKDNKALLESYKKLRAGRHSAHIKVKVLSDDVTEMRKMVSETWGDKFNMDQNDRILYKKCQDILSISTDTMRHYINEAKRFDEELNKVKEKLPKELLAEVAKLSTKEDITELKVSSDITYVLFDGGKHVCSFCNKILKNISDMMEHLHTPMHKQNAASEKDWINDFRKKPNEGKKADAKATLHPVSGIEFMKPTSGYFCTLCKEHAIDHIEAESHLKSSDHLVKYKNHTTENPLYENKCTVKRYARQSVAIKAIKEKRMKETKEKVEQLAKRRREEAAAVEKVKEKIKDQQSKEKNVEELEEMGTDNLTSNNQKVSGIKLTLSGDKLKTSENKIKDKPVQKLVYIGKAPNYKATAKKARPLPWYKRDASSEDPDSNKTSSADIVKKLKEKIALQVSPAISSSVEVEKELGEKTSVPFVPSEVASSAVDDTNKLSRQSSAAVKKLSLATTSQKEIADTCLTEQESKNVSDNSIKNKEVYGPVYQVEAAEISETKSLNSGNNNKTEVKSGPKDRSASSTSDIKNFTKSQIAGVSSPKKNLITSDESKTNNKSIDPIINQAIKNILYGTDTVSHQDISLTEIKLPKIPQITDSSQQSPNSKKSINEPTAKDISVHKNCSLSRVLLPEAPDVSQQPLPMPRDSINEATPMDISPIKDFHMEFPDVHQPPPPLPCGSTNETAPIVFIDISKPPPLIRETLKEQPAPIGFLDVSQPPPALPINMSTPVDVPPNTDFQIGFPDISQPPPLLARNTINEPTSINVPTTTNFQNVPPQLRKCTEEEKDFMILGINKDDFMPLVVPVPPPLSLLHHSSYVRNVARAESPSFFPSSVVPDLNQVQAPSTGTIKVIQNNPFSQTMKNKKSVKNQLKSNQSNLITISPSKNQNLKSETTLSDTESKVVQFDNAILNVDKNEKDKLPKLNTEQFATAKMENSMKSECGDVIKDEIMKQLSESDVEFISVASKQSVVSGVTCFKSIEKSQIKGEILNLESKLDVVSNRTGEDKSDLLKKSSIGQLPPLNVQNSMRSECDEIRQECTESEITKLIAVTSETVNICERKNEEFQVNVIKKSDASILDITAKKVEEDHTSKLDKSGVEQLASLEFEKNMRHEYETIKDELQESEIIVIVPVMSKESPDQKAEKTLIISDCMRSENIDSRSQITESQEVEVENLVLDIPVSEMEVSHEDNLKKTDMGHLVSFEVENNMFADNKVTKNEFNETLKDSEIGYLTCKSRNSIASEKESDIKIVSAAEKIQLTSERVAILEKKISQIKCDIKKDDVSLTPLENIKSVDPSSKTKSIPLVASEDSAASKFSGISIEKMEEDKLLTSSIEHMVSQVENIISDKVNTKLQNSELKTSPASQNVVESETESKMELTHVSFNENISQIKKCEIKKDDVSLTPLENMKSVDSSSETKSIPLVASEDSAASKFSDISIEKMEEDKLLESSIEHMVSEVENMISDEVNTKLQDSELKTSLASQNVVESETESKMELTHVSFNESISQIKCEIKKDGVSLTPLENMKSVDSSSETKSVTLVASEDSAASKFSDISIEKMEEDKLLESSIEHMLSQVENIISDEVNTKLQDSGLKTSLASQNVVESETESKVELTHVSFNESISQIKCEIKKDDVSLTPLENMKSIDSSSKTKSIPLVASEDSAASNFSDISIEKMEEDKLLTSSIEHMVSQVENIISDEVNIKLQDSELKTSLALQNVVESETESKMELTRVNFNECISQIKCKIMKDDVSLTPLENMKSVDSSSKTKSITLVASKGSAASKFSDISIEKMKEDKLLKSSIECMVSQVENIISDEVNTKLQDSELKNYLTSQNITQSVTESNMELTHVTSNESISQIICEIKTGEVQPLSAFGNMASVDSLSKIKNSIPLVASEGPAVSTFSDVSIEKMEENKLLKSSIEHMISQVENIISDEVITKLQDSELKNSLASQNIAQSETESNMELTHVTFNECITSEKTIVAGKKRKGEKIEELPLITLEHVSKRIDLSEIKESSEKETSTSNLISMKQLKAVSGENIIPNVSNRNECSLDSEKDNINYDEVPILEMCQEERYVKHEVCNSKHISSVNELSPNDLNASSRSVKVLETMPVLTSENTSDSLDIIEHEQSNSVQQFDPPVLESESLKSTKEVDETLLINNESNAIQQTSKAFKSATSNKHTEQNHEQPSKFSGISILKPEFVVPADVKSLLGSSETLTTNTQDFPISEMEIDQETSTEIPVDVKSLLESLKTSTAETDDFPFSKMEIDQETSTEVFSSLQKSVSEEVSSTLLDALNKTVLDSNKSSATEDDSSTQVSVDEKSVDIHNIVSKLDPLCKGNSPANSKTDDYEILTPDAMDCSPILETGVADTEDKTWAISLKSQKEDDLNFFLSLIADEKEITKVSKEAEMEGSDTDEYNEE